jgi:hypothetical protein
VAKFIYSAAEIFGHSGRKMLKRVGNIDPPVAEVTVLNPSDLLGKEKTCFSQKRYGRVID